MRASDNGRPIKAVRGSACIRVNDRDRTARRNSGAKDRDPVAEVGSGLKVEGCPRRTIQQKSKRATVEAHWHQLQLDWLQRSGCPRQRVGHQQRTSGVCFPEVAPGVAGRGVEVKAHHAAGGDLFGGHQRLTIGPVRHQDSASRRVNRVVMITIRAAVEGTDADQNGIGGLIGDHRHLRALGLVSSGEGEIAVGEKAALNAVTPA